MYDIDLISFSDRYIFATGKDAVKFQKYLEEAGGTYTELIPKYKTAWIFKTEDTVPVRTLLQDILDGKIPPVLNTEQEYVSRKDFIMLSSRVRGLDDKIAHLCEAVNSIQAFLSKT